jgi:hypothetical protein
MKYGPSEKSFTWMTSKFAMRKWSGLITQLFRHLFKLKTM